MITWLVNAITSICKFLFGWMSPKKKEEQENNMAIIQWSPITIPDPTGTNFWVLYGNHGAPMISDNMEVMIWTGGVGGSTDQTGSAIFVSTNQGANWSTVYPMGSPEPHGQENWYANMDSDGSHVLLNGHWLDTWHGGTYYGQYYNYLPMSYMYYSSNSGASFTNVSPTGWDPRLTYTKGVLSSDGSILMCCSSDSTGASSGYIWKSTNAGASWTPKYPVAGSHPWQELVMSGDGSKVLAPLLSKFYYSTNGGDNWSEYSIQANSYYNGARMSTDGTLMTIVCTDIDSGVATTYISNNGGSNWSVFTPPLSLPSGATLDRSTTGTTQIYPGYVTAGSINSGSSWERIDVTISPTTWVSGHSYAQGDYVIDPYDGYSYMCVYAHTSSPSNEPYQWTGEWSNVYTDIKMTPDGRKFSGMFANYEFVDGQPYYKIDYAIGDARSTSPLPTFFKTIA